MSRGVFKLAIVVGILLLGSLSVSNAEVGIFSPPQAASDQIYQLNKRLLKGEDSEKIKKEFEGLISYWKERGVSPEFLASRWNATQITFAALIFEHYKAAIYYTDGSRDDEIEWEHRRFLKRLGIDPDQLRVYSRESAHFKEYKKRLDSIKKHEEVIEETAKLIQSRNLWDYLEAENDVERIKIDGLLDVDLRWARENAKKTGVSQELLLEREKALLHFYSGALGSEISTLKTVTGGVVLAPLVPVSMALAPVLFGITATQSATLAAIPMGLMGVKGLSSFIIRSSFNREYFNGSNLYSDLLSHLVSSVPYAAAAPLIGGGIGRMMVSETAFVSKAGTGIFYSLLGLGALDGTKNVVSGGNHIYEGNAEQGTLLIADGAIDIVAAGLILKYARVQKEPQSPQTETYYSSPSETYPINGKPESAFRFNSRGWQENYLPPEQSWKTDFNPSTHIFNKLHNPFSELKLVPETMTRTTLPESSQEFHVLNKPFIKPLSNPGIGVMPQDDEDTELREIIRRDKRGNIILRRYIRIKKGLSSDDILRSYGIQLSLTSLDEIVGAAQKPHFSIMNIPQASSGGGGNIQGASGVEKDEYYKIVDAALYGDKTAQERLQKFIEEDERINKDDASYHEAKAFLLELRQGKLSMDESQRQIVIDYLIESLLKGSISLRTYVLDTLKDFKTSEVAGALYTYILSGADGFPEKAIHILGSMNTEESVKVLVQIGKYSPFPVIKEGVLAELRLLTDLRLVQQAETGLMFNIELLEEADGNVIGTIEDTLYVLNKKLKNRYPMESNLGEIMFDIVTGRMNFSKIQNQEAADTLQRQIIHTLENHSDSEMRRLAAKALRRMKEDGIDIFDAEQALINAVVRDSSEDVCHEAAETLAELRR